MAKILRNLERIMRLKLQNEVFLVCQKSTFSQYCIQNVEDGIQI